jgi:hypothetical protein
VDVALLCAVAVVAAWIPARRAMRVSSANSVFLNEEFRPWPDQWAFLASLRRVGRVQVERIVDEAERRGRILGVRLPPQEDGDDQPWTAPPSRHRKEAAIMGDLPPTLDLVLSNQIYVAKEGLHPSLRNRLLRLAACQNPEFYRAQSMRLSTYDKPRVIACAEDYPHHIGMPRGCFDDVRQTLTDLGIRAIVRDERHNGTPLEARFRGELRREQKVAADAMLRHDTGILAATTAFGKTVVAAWLIAQRGVNTLGHHPIIFMQCGPVRHRVNARAQAASRPFEHFVLVQPTAFLPTRSPDSDKRVEFQALYQELIDNESRTRRICDDVAAAVRDGRSPLVLTERNDHLDLLEQGLATRVQHVVVLRAGLSKKQREAITDRLAAIPGEEARVILATGKYVGEGFDDSRLDTLFLTLPVSWRGTIAQYAGRLHRLYDGKREVRIYDYVDLKRADAGAHVRSPLPRL